MNDLRRTVTRLLRVCSSTANCGRDVRTICVRGLRWRQQRSHSHGSNPRHLDDRLVHGGKIYGTMPTLELAGPDDASNLGRWIPTIAVDQFAATLAGWFGADAAALKAVLPNLGAFAPGPLGFI